VIGAIIGGVVGSRAAQERFMSLPLPRRISFNPFRRDGMEVGLGFTF
jgi:hypothetical protein